MKTLTKIGLVALVAALIAPTLAQAQVAATPLNAQESESTNNTSKDSTENVVNTGYNALQGTIQNSGEYLFRMYNNASINISKDLKFNAKIMNQTEPAYTDGWETLTLNKEGFPVAPLYVMRTEGNDFKDFKPIAHGVGVRITLDDYLPFDMYGFLDGVMWADKKENWVGEGESFLYLGKGNIGLLAVYRPNGNNFIELEAFTNPISTKIGDFSLVGRVEITNFDMKKSRAVLGIQYKP